MTLDALKKPGERARIVEVSGEDSLTVRLMEMGFIEEVEVELIGRAPLGDPIEFELRGYRISLRSDEARRITVEKLF